MADKPRTYRVRLIDRDLRESTAAINENKEEVNRRLQERSRAKSPEKPPPDFLSVQEWIVDEMWALSGPVFECDDKFGDARNAANRLTRRSKNALKGFDQQMRFERNGIKVNCGDEAISQLGMAARPSGDRYLALAQGQTILRLTGDPAVAGGITPLDGRPEVKFDEVRTRMEEKVNGLSTALDVQKEQQKEVESARTFLDEEVGRFQDAFGQLVAIEKGMMKLAGLGDIAARLRAPKLKLKKKKSDAETGDGETPQTQADTPQTQADTTPSSPPSDTDAAATGATA